MFYRQKLVPGVNEKSVGDLIPVLQLTTGRNGQDGDAVSGRMNGLRNVCSYGFSLLSSSDLRRSLRLLETTLTLLRAMAAPPIMGLSRNPLTG